MKIVIIGAGQNGCQVYNILKHDRTVEVVGFLDDSAALHGQDYRGVPILGGTSLAKELHSAGRIGGAIVAIGSNRVRARLTEAMEHLGLTIVSAIHPHVVVDDTARIGAGSIIEMGVMIHPEARIGRGVFVGGSSVIAHHCVVGDYALVGGGVIFGGEVTVGEFSTLGVGTVLQPQAKIGRNVTTGIGAAVVKDLPDNAVAVGVPAKVIRLAEPGAI